MHRRIGFTLIELLVVIAIIAIPDRAIVTGRTEGAGGGGTNQVPEQPETTGARRLQLPRVFEKFRPA